MMMYICGYLYTVTRLTALVGKQYQEKGKLSSGVLTSIVVLAMILSAFWPVFFLYRTYKYLCEIMELL